MTKARGKVEKVDLLQITGLDSRVWQKDGSSTDNSGVVYTLKGEVAKTLGVQPLIEWATRRGEVDKPTVISSADEVVHYLAPVWPFYDPATGETHPLMSIGAFNMNGAVEILLEYGGNIAVVRGNTVEVLASGRRVARRPSEGTQFVQVGGAVLILNGFDGNLKWDGKKVSPLGIASPPSAPILSTYSDGTYPGGVSLFTDFDSFYPGIYIEKTSDDSVNEYSYKMTWVNDQGTESEDSEASEIITDSNVSAAVATRGMLILVANLAQDPGRKDIVGRRLYRAGFGASAQGDFFFLADLPGTHSETYIDSTVVTYDSLVQLPAPGSRMPPPTVRFAAEFRGRTYYAGDPAAPQLLYYSLPKGQKESVSIPENIIQITTEDGSDYITAIAIASDYGVVFTKRSMHMLTVGRDGEPNLTPVSQTIGAVGHRAVANFEGTLFFFSHQGIFAFDGSAPKPLSSQLNQQVTNLPEAFLKDVVAFTDPDQRRVCFSVCAGPGSENNEVWAVHVDTGAVSKIGVSVFDALRYKNETACLLL